jgi:hypothetical protein
MSSLARPLLWSEKATVPFPVAALIEITYQVPMKGMPISRVLAYQRCPRCGVYAASGRDECFYCGEVFKEVNKISPIGVQILASLRSLWPTHQRGKPKDRPHRGDSGRD